MDIPEAAIRSFGSKFNGGRSLILPTTKFFFEKVLGGTKSTEYRKDAPYYDRLFADTSKLEDLFLHYRSGVIMRCRLHSVRKIKRPAELSGSRFITTERCYALKISDAEIVS